MTAPVSNLREAFTCTERKPGNTDMKTLLAAAAATLAVATLTTDAHADAVRFDLGLTETLVPNDDRSTGAVEIGFTVNFFGNVDDTLFVNNNGNVTLDQPLSSFTPFDLTSTNREIIAPFFADVDTRGTGTVTYGQTMVNGRDAFAVTYDGVGYFNTRTDRTNTFQVILIDRSDTGEGNFDIEFNYDQIQFETGGASGGQGGLGGDSARVGYSNGSGVEGTFFELAGSAQNGSFLDGSDSGLALIANMLNSDVAGRYVFFARGGDVVVTDPIPLPGAAVFLMTGLAGAAAARRRKG